MSIWQYNDKMSEVDEVQLVVDLDSCLFCRSSLDVLKDEAFEWQDSSEGISLQDAYVHKRVRVCSVCGWWNARYETRSKDSGSFGGTERHVYGAGAVLRRMDLTDVSTPLEEVRQYLVAKYEARFGIHPRLLELTVASVFKDYGYDAVATSYSGDYGIDAVLKRSDGLEIGVQVKRYRSSIVVEQVRSFFGALVLGGYTRGIFVTTSKFQRGAPAVATQASLRGTPVELMDAQRFLDALRIAQRRMYASKQEFASLGPGEDLKDHLMLLESDIRHSPGSWSS